MTRFGKHASSDTSALPQRDHTPDALELRQKREEQAQRIATTRTQLREAIVAKEEATNERERAPILAEISRLTEQLREQQQEQQTLRQEEREVLAPDQLMIHAWQYEFNTRVTAYLSTLEAAETARQGLCAFMAAALGHRVTLRAVHHGHWHLHSFVQQVRQFLKDEERYL